MIKVDKLRLSLGGNEVLKGVSLSIEDGETAVIMGRSGAGKSVLIKAIVGLLACDSGRIIVDGLDIRSSARKQLYRLRQKFGFVFQGAALFDSLTVFGNIALPLREHARLKRVQLEEAVNRALEMVQMEGTGLLYPSELSGGMQKRVSIARALVANPAYVFYDEPTTGLDPVTADTINQLIVRLSRASSATSVVVTHDLHSAFRVGDRIMFLSEGVVKWEGPPERDELMKSDAGRSFMESAGFV